MKMSLRFRFTLSMAVAGTGFIGAAECKLIDILSYGGTGKFYDDKWGAFASLMFSGCMFVGMFILLPLEVARGRKLTEKVQKHIDAGLITPERMSRLERIVFWANFGNLPKWVYLPVLGLACTLAGLTVLALIGMVCWFFFS